MVTRHERVILELEDRFSTRMARAAAATALMNRNLRDLDGTSIRTRNDATKPRARCTAPVATCLREAW